MADDKNPPLDLKKILSPKQREIIRIAREKNGAKKVVGLFGVRKSGKSIGALHAIADHLWRVNNATFLILVRAQGDGLTGGLWSQIIKDVFPYWMTHSIGDGEMCWAEGGKPKATISKKMTAAVTNLHGGTSTLLMDSLDNEDEIDKYKGRAFTGILLCEAGEFVKDLTFSTLFMALRGIGYEQDDFLFLLDANPPKEGEEHFLYRRFYEERLKENQTDAEKAFSKCLHVTEWDFSDNPFITEQEIQEIKTLYANDPELFDRYCLKLWKRATRDLLFADLFKRSIHTYGDERDGMLLLPSEGCRDLITSTDPGGMNPCSYIVEQVIDLVPYLDKDEKEKTREQKSFLFLDEIASIGEETLVSTHTSRVMDKMDFWEHEAGWSGDEFQLRNKWQHFSDRAALDFKESIVMRSVSDEVFAHSGGRIKFIGVEKGSGSVEHRIRLWRKLLMENRIIISGLRCPGLIKMNEQIKKNKDGVFKKGDPLKHYADAAQYCLVNLLWDELQAMTRRIRVQARKESGSSGLVQINL